MKGLFSVFALVLLTTAVFGQASPAKGILYSYKSTGTDTLGASTTLTFKYTEGSRDVDFVTPWEYSWTVKSDSISGADNSGTVALQFSNSPASVASPLWVTADTKTIDGTADQFLILEGTIYARRMRLLITSPSGTRKTAINVEGTAKRLIGQ